MIALHHAHAAQRFGEPAGDFGGDFGAGAEDRANGFERLADADAEKQQDAERHGGHLHAGVNQVHQGDGRGHQATNKLDQPGADEIADTFHVAHDARDERAGFVGVIKRDGQAADVRLHLLSQFGDHLLGGFGKQLREAERREALSAAMSTSTPPSTVRRARAWRRCRRAS